MVHATASQNQQTNENLQPSQRETCSFVEFLVNSQDTPLVLAPLFAVCLPKTGDR